MVREALVCCQVGEGLGKGNKRVLHKAEAAEPEDSKTGDSAGSPVAVQILLNRLVEDAIATDTMKVITLTRELSHVQRAHGSRQALWESC